MGRPRELDRQRLTDTAEALDCLVPDSFCLAAEGVGTLSGRTFVAKDLFAVAGHTPSFGHPRWRETHRPSELTAPVIETLRRAGATMLGLTRLDQLAYSLVGNVGEGEPPVNSLYPGRFTGGSSSGTAAAVAGGVGDFGVGTDTVGSIRVPAASCGLFSIRPTHAAIDSSGVLPLAPSFDVVGILAREPFVLRDAHASISLAQVGQSAPLQRVLLARDCLEDLDPDLAQAIVGLAALLRARIGVDVVEASFARFTESRVTDLLSRLQAREIWASHSSWILANREHLAPDVRGRLERAELLAAASAQERAADTLEWEEYRRDYERELGAAGTAVLLAVTPGLPPPRAASQAELLAFRAGCLRWSAPSSMTGSAQVVVPVRASGSGLTYGVGLLGARGGDSSLLAAVCAAFADGQIPPVGND
jgi:amidase